MRTVVHGERPVELEEWLQRRIELGLDQFDEVWAGEYHVAPAAHGRHGDIDQQLAELLGPATRAVGLRCLGPVNIGSPHDYRVPDRSIIRADSELDVFLPSAIVVVEIVSPDDGTFAKFGFYFEHGVQELLVVDPGSSSVTWFSRSSHGFEVASGSAVVPGVDDLADQLRWPD